jgi:hypothetical protein
MNEAGATLDPSGVTITEAAGSPGWRQVSAVFDGTDYFVVWCDTGARVRGTKVPLCGPVLDSVGVTIPSQSASSPAVTCCNGYYLVTWIRNSNGTHIYRARVSRDGTPLDSIGRRLLVVMSDQTRGALAYDGTNSLVVWEDARAGIGRIYGARVDSNGEVLDPTGFPIACDSIRLGSPALALDGMDYLVAYERGTTYSDIFGRRVSPQGGLPDSAAFAISAATGYQRAPSVTFDGSNFLVVWGDHQSGGDDARGARVSPLGAVLDTHAFIVLRTGEYSQTPAAAFAGHYSLVVARSQGGGSGYIECARVTPEGTVLDSVPFLLPGKVDAQTCPACARQTQGFYVAWEDWRKGDETDIYGVRLSASGVMLDSVSMPVSKAVGNQLRPVACTGDSDAFVVWEDLRNGAYDIYGARVARNGSTRDTGGIAISENLGWQRRPRVACGAGFCFAVWDDLRAGSYYNVYGCRVRSDGGVADPDGIPISTAPDDQLVGGVAWDGVNFLAVWEDWRAGTPHIRGARVNPAGQVLDSQALLVSGLVGSQQTPRVAFGLDSYFVVWVESFPGVRNICGARVSRDGCRLDSNRTAISPSLRNQQNPAVVFAQGQYFLFWEETDSLGSLIRGAQLTEAGAVFDTFSILPTEECRGMRSVAVTTSSADQVLAVYSAWTGIFGGRTYDTTRIWGYLGPFGGVEERRSSEAQCPLLDVRPNPFCGTATVHFLCRQAASAHVRFYDAAGRRVRDMALFVRSSPGQLTAAWDGTDDLGRALPQGVYYARAEARSGERASTRAVLLR